MKDPGCLPVALWLLEPFALEKCPSLFRLVDLAVGFVHSLCDYLGVNAFDFEVGDYAAAAEFFVVAAKGGIGCGVGGVVQVFLVSQALNHAFDNSFIGAADP